MCTPLEFYLVCSPRLPEVTYSLRSPCEDTSNLTCAHVCRSSVSGEHDAAQRLLQVPGLALATARHTAVLHGWRSLPACFTGQASRALRSTTAVATCAKSVSFRLSAAYLNTSFAPTRCSQNTQKKTIKKKTSFLSFTPCCP